ncbi:pheromone A receptor-domain-containing protein [Xylariaceae sp. FL0016]|nr:pheromone A receptor-domain-containing protein [Xylariaceae sp. FL0016]
MATNTEADGNQSLVANLVLRVLFAFIGTALCWVPFRLLYRNGEFAAAVLIIDVALMNCFTILNSLIWNNDNWNTWWDGAGLCDLEVYLTGPLQTVYAASIFTVMYNLAQLVGPLRMSLLDRRAQTRRKLMQAAIIFVVPIFQLIFTYFDLAQRYIVGTLIGCSAVYDSSWPKNLVFDTPPAMFAVLAVPYAILTWKRFRAISRQTQAVLKSRSSASARAYRTRLRLYNMSLSILVIYLPLMLYFLSRNIQDTLVTYKEYSFARIHRSSTPYPWNSIMFIPSWIIPAPVMNQPWIPIATAAAIFAFFGLSLDAKKLYHEYSVSMRLCHCFACINYHRAPDSNDVGGSNEMRPKKAIPAHITSGGCVDHDDRSNILPKFESHLATARSRLDYTSTTNKPSNTLSPPTVDAPAIPPRQSSLRHAFVFRKPTLPSIPISLRLPSIASLSKSQNVYPFNLCHTHSYNTYVPKLSDDIWTINGSRGAKSSPLWIVPHSDHARRVTHTLYDGLEIPERNDLGDQTASVMLGKNRKSFHGFGLGRVGQRRADPRKKKKKKKKGSLHILLRHHGLQIITLSVQGLTTNELPSAPVVYGTVQKQSTRI